MSRSKRKGVKRIVLGIILVMPTAYARWAGLERIFGQNPYVFAILAIIVWALAVPYILE